MNENENIMPFTIVVECDNVGGIVYAMGDEIILDEHSFTRNKPGSFWLAHDEAVNDAKRYLQQEQMKKVYRKQSLDELCDKLFN